LEFPYRELFEKDRYSGRQNEDVRTEIEEQCHLRKRCGECAEDEACLKVKGKLCSQ
jgi:hypothetical protein